MALNTNRLRGKTALITGASSGFGRACAVALAELGVHLILLARRENLLAGLQTELNHYDIFIKILVADVRDNDLLTKKLSPVLATQKIDILINNAGLASGLDKIDQGDLLDWEAMIDTNVKGLLYVSRLVLPSMRQQNSGHVINIGSMAGNMTYPMGNVYCATKSAAHSLSEAMNIDLEGTNIRVSNIAPGAADTEFSKVRFHGDAEKSTETYQGFKPLSAEDVADMIVYVLNAPEHVNVQQVNIMPTAQRTPYHLHRTKG